MFGVVYNALAVGFELKHGLFDYPQVGVERGEEDISDVKRPRFAKDCANRRSRIYERFDVGVAFGLASDTASGTKCADERIPQFHITSAFKELNILWIRTVPAAFNERNGAFLPFLRNA